MNKRTQIPRDELVENTWYVGRGRNANVALWCRVGKAPAGRLTFLTIGFTFHNPVIKDEDYYMTEHDQGTQTQDGQPIRKLVSYGCFQPFMAISEGTNTEPVGTSAWDRHYAKTLSFTD